MNPGIHSAALIARILQPLARSLEEARRQLDLEAPETSPDDETAADDPSVESPGYTFTPRPPHAAALHPRHPAALDGLSPKETASTNSRMSIGAIALTGANTTAAPAPEAPTSGAAPAAGILVPPASAKGLPDTGPDLALKSAFIFSPAQPARATQAVLPAQTPSFPTNTVPPESSFTPAETHASSTPAGLALRLPDRQSRPPQPGQPSATPGEPIHPTALQPYSAPLADEAVVPQQVHGAAPSPARTLGTSKRSPDWNARPDQHVPTDPASPSLRLRHRPPEPEPLGTDHGGETPVTSDPSPPRPTAPHSQLPSRKPALSRVMRAMEPVLDKAWQLTDANLREQDDGADRTPSSRMDEARPANEPPRVSNHFQVNVALSGDAAGRISDPAQLEDALVALLRDAARRQGLDV